MKKLTVLLILSLTLFFGCSVDIDKKSNEINFSSEDVKIVKIYEQNYHIPTFTVYKLTVDTGEYIIVQSNNNMSITKK